MSKSSLDKVAAAIEQQGEAIKSFRKRQDARLCDVSKRVDKLEARGISAVTDAPGYSEMFNACADLVEGSPCSRLASAALLNAALAIALTTMGGDALADLLRQTADRVPTEEARAKNQLT